MFLKIQLLVLLIGSVTFQAATEEASTALLEDETATGANEDSQPPTSLPTKQETITDIFLSEEQTTESAVSASGDSENSTYLEVPENSEDGLETATLVGIIIGIIVAIGVVTGIIITIAKKMSGRYSP